MSITNDESKNLSTAGMTPVSTVDVLEQDPEIRGQKFVCLSFISPEDVLIAKEPFMYSKFISEFSNEMKGLFANLNEYFKDNTSVLETINLVRERYDYIYSDNVLQQEFEFFKEKNNYKLEEEYLQRNKFRTTVRGIKVRGTYDTFEEAKVRAETIRKFDKQFHVYVAQVGCWCPWSPYPSILADQEYVETSLNSLVKTYIENEEQKDMVYKDRKEDMMERIRKDMEERKDLWMSAKEKEDTERAANIEQEEATTST